MFGKNYRLKIMLLSTWFAGFSLFAAFNVYDFEDPQQQQQFTTLIDELRCPKCQNNNLSDSNAPLATDIKNYVYQSVKSGKSSEEITAFLISRYGEFVTYRPQNIWVWVLPTLIGIFAGGVAVWVIAAKRREKKIAQDIPDMASVIRRYEEDKNND